MKTSKNFNRVVSGVLATSILGTSCTPYQIFDDNLYGEIQNNPDIGKLAIPISLELKTDDAKYIKAIQKITNDIFKSPAKAKAFNEDPISELKKYGYNGEVNLDDNLLNLTRALSDNEIISAIKRNDISLYIKLCLEKGIISSSQGIFSDNFYQEQFNKILENKEMKDLIDSLSNHSFFRQNAPKECIFPVIIIAVAGAAVVAYLAVGFATWLICDVNVVFTLESPKIKTLDNFFNNNNSNILEIYTIASDNKNAHIFVDNYFEDRIDETISLIKEIKPDIINNESEVAIRNFIKINITSQLNNID